MKILDSKTINTIGFQPVLNNIYRTTLVLLMVGLPNIALSSEQCDISGCQNIAHSQLQSNNNGPIKNDDVWTVVEDIVQVAGLEPNFEVQPNTQRRNASAVIKGDKRFLEYDPYWFKEMLQTADGVWMLYGIMAHEIGHHLQGHTVLGRGSFPAIELEADAYAGFVIAGLGGSLNQAQTFWKTLPPGLGSLTHPGRDDRLDAIDDGWNRWHENLERLRNTAGLSLPQKNEANTDHIIIASSSQRLLNSTDVNNLTRKQLRIARNEIFARHGYIFNSSDLKSIFKNTTWYQPSTRSVSLNKIEQANVFFLRNAEKKGVKKSNTDTPFSHYTGYLNTSSSKRLLNKHELSKYSHKQLRYIRNEIYARHGYIFSSNDLSSYFQKQPWYTAKFRSVSLSETEQANVQLIKSLEK